MESKIDQMTYLALVEAAMIGVKNALTINNNELDARFGASVLTNRGNIYSAGQYYSDTLSLTLHAEQAALAHAASHGEHAIDAIAIIGNEAAYQMSGGKIYPCHLCKQLLWESHLRSGINTEILIVDFCGDLLESVSLLNIMSRPWPIRKCETQSDKDTKL